jgi:stage II sporulation protein AA (anti-sigma F factor antagonist)
MEIGEERPSEGILIVVPQGRVDSTTSGELERRLLQHVEKGERRLVVDLARIEYISSAGLRVLLLVAKRLQAAEGRLVLCTLGPAVWQVFELAGFLPIFEIAASREEVLEHLRG